MAAGLFAGVTYKLRDLAAALGCVLSGDGDIEITGIAGMEHAGPGDLTFLANPKYTHKVKQTRAAAILITEPLPDASPGLPLPGLVDHQLVRAHLVAALTWFGLALVAGFLYSLQLLQHRPQLQPQ